MSLSALSRLWPFCCHGHCSQHHVHHAFASILGHYWSLLWSNSLSVLLPGALQSSLGVLPRQPVDVFMNLSTAHATLCLLHKQADDLWMHIWVCEQPLLTDLHPLWPQESKRWFSSGLAQSLKQPYFLINTSGLWCCTVKVSFPKLSFWAGSNPSLPFSLLLDLGFLYKFIKLIPFSAWPVGEVWMNYESTQYELSHAFQSCRYVKCLLGACSHCHLLTNGS